MCADKTDHWSYCSPSIPAATTTVGAKVVGGGVATTEVPDACFNLDCEPIGCSDAWCQPACSNNTYQYKKEGECCESCHVDHPAGMEAPKPPPANRTPPTAAPLDASADASEVSVGLIVGAVLGIIVVTIVGACIARTCEKKPSAYIAKGGDLITNPTFPSDLKQTSDSTYAVGNFAGHRKRMETADAVAMTVVAAAAASAATTEQAGSGAANLPASDPVYSEAHYDSGGGFGSEAAEYADADEAMAAMESIQANGGRRPSYLVPGVGLQSSSSSGAPSWMSNTMISEYADPDQLRELDGHNDVSGTGTITSMSSIGSLLGNAEDEHAQSMRRLLSSAVTFSGSGGGGAGGSEDGPEYADADEAMASMQAMQANGGRRPSYLVPGVGLTGATVSGSVYAGFGAMGANGMIEEAAYAAVPEGFEGDEGAATAATVVNDYEYQESVVGMPVQEHVYATANLSDEVGGGGGAGADAGASLAADTVALGHQKRGYMNLDPDAVAIETNGVGDGAAGSRGYINLNPDGSSKGGASTVVPYRNLNPDGSAIGHADPIGYANQQAIQEHMELQRHTDDVGTPPTRLPPMTSSYSPPRKLPPSAPRSSLQVQPPKQKQTQTRVQKQQNQLPRRVSSDGSGGTGPQLKARKQVKAKRRQDSNNRNIPSSDGARAGVNGRRSAVAGAGAGVGVATGRRNGSGQGVPQQGRLGRDNSFC